MKQTDNSVVLHLSTDVRDSSNFTFFFFLFCLLFFCAARKRPYEGYTSSDSEEEILRRLRMQQSDSVQSGGHLSKYGAGTLNENLNNGLQHITIASHRETFNDPLGVAERGKVGVPSSSECSSNSSADASVESNMGILNGEKKGTKNDENHIKAIYKQINRQSAK